MGIFSKEKRINVGCARVSSPNQKNDLKTQIDFLNDYAKKNDIQDFCVIEDLGSGLNFKKKGLNKLIGMIICKEIDTLYLTHKDRLLRFGSELIVSIAAQFGTKVIFIYQKEDLSA